VVRNDIVETLRDRAATGLRALLAAFIAFALGAFGAGAAEEPLPASEIAPGVHVYAGIQAEPNVENGDAIANIGFIVGETSVMVIDPGGSAREGAWLRAAVRRVTELPVRYVVLTHVHPDHIFGAVGGEGAEVIGHAKLPGALAQRGGYYTRSLRRAIGETAEGSEIVLPTRTVETSVEIDLG
jgi:glyoxylase-like metal-dependent hydrolase (beta-lactamase superfamily II)